MSESYESTDLTDRSRGLGLAAAVVGGALALGLVGAWATQAILGGAPPAAVAVALPVDQLAALRQAVEADWAARATAYARVAGAVDVARIPVARAAELLLARGFPTRPGVSRPVPARGDL